MARRLSDPELRLWVTAMQAVRPLRAVDAPARPAAPERPAAPSPAVLPVPVRPAAAHPPRPSVEVGQRPSGLDDTSWRSLESGRLRAERRLDLHGRTAQAAFAALHAFLLRADASGLRCVEIITGLGSGESGGILRRELPLWLGRHDLRPLVLAVVYSKPGNPGAVRLLLRRRSARSGPEGGPGQSPGWRKRSG